MPPVLTFMSSIINSSIQLLSLLYLASYLDFDTHHTSYIPFIDCNIFIEYSMFYSPFDIFPYIYYVYSTQRSVSSALALPSAKATGANPELTVAAVLLTGLYGASGQWLLDM